MEKKSPASSSRKQDDPFRRFKIGKTAGLLLAWIALGWYSTIISPTLPDLRDRLGTSMEQISLAVGTKNIGMLLGCVIGSMVADRYRRTADLVLGLSAITSGVATIGKPFCGSVGLLGFVCFMDGVGHGGLDSVGHAVLQWTWGDESGPPMHAMHLGYSVGCTIAPLTAYPFLGPQAEDGNSTVSTVAPTVSTTTAMLLNSTDVPQPVSRIEIPYGIVGGFTIAVGLVFVIWSGVGVPSGMTLSGTDKTNFRDVFSPAACAKSGTTTCYTLAIIVLSCVFVLFLSGKENTMDTFVFSYLVDSKIPFTNKEAALLDTAYRSAGIAGRAGMIVLAHWAPPQPMLFVETILGAVFVSCVAFIGDWKKSYMWIFLCFVKFVGDPVWPTAVLWTGSYVTLFSMVAALFIFMFGLASFFFNWLVGYLYDDFSPDAVMYVAMGSAIAKVVVACVMQLVASRCPGRGRAEGPGNEKVVVVTAETADCWQSVEKSTKEVESTKM